MNLVFFVFYCTLMTATPGPTNIMILTTVHNYGVKKALIFAYGSAFAFFTLLCLSAIFNSILMVYLPKIIIVLQVFGTAYILYLAYSILRIDSGAKKQSSFISFKAAFLMQFINPKSVLFALTVFPTFIMPYYESFWYLLIFAVFIAFISTLAFLSWVLFGKVLKSFLDRYAKMTNNIMALFLVVCAAMISGLFN